MADDNAATISHIFLFWSRPGGLMYFPNLYIYMYGYIYILKWNFPQEMKGALKSLGWFRAKWVRLPNLWAQFTADSEF